MAGVVAASKIGLEKLPNYQKMFVYKAKTHHHHHHHRHKTIVVTSSNNVSKSFRLTADLFRVESFFL
jgi:hypothetical protein